MLYRNWTKGMISYTVLRFNVLVFILNLYSCFFYLVQSILSHSYSHILFTFIFFSFTVKFTKGIEWMVPNDVAVRRQFARLSRLSIEVVHHWSFPQNNILYFFVVVVVVVIQYLQQPRPHSQTCTINDILFSKGEKLFCPNQTKGKKLLVAAENLPPFNKINNNNKKCVRFKVKNDSWTSNDRVSTTWLDSIVCPLETLNYTNRQPNRIEVANRFNEWMKFQPNKKKQSTFSN